MANKGFYNWFYDNRFVILALTSVAVGGIVLYDLIKKKKKMNWELGNSTETVGQIIYSMPKTKAEKYKVVIVFGGMSYANPQYMLTQIPKVLLSRAIFVIAPYTVPYSTVTQNMNKYFETKKIVVEDLSIIGFSAGGINVQTSYNKDFRFVGLIDPSTRSQYTQIDFDKNAKMVYNDANWGGYPSIKPYLPILETAINSKGGNAEKVNLAHNKIPSYFFNKFINEIA